LDLPAVQVQAGKGCNRCGGRGLRGRSAAFEIMPMSDTLRELVLKRVSGADLRGTAISEGMQTMRDSGRRKVLDGTTTPEEVLRVLFTED
jgi:type II secretory ATPase GspE/PulE/Tfp pilus assembly ATPase PilB-like protein